MTDLVYAVGDIHGRFDLLTKAIEWIESDSDGQPHTVVFLGDYIDRGPQSKEVLNTLIAGPTKYKSEWVCLQGNHESMMTQCFRNEARWEWWFANGGGQTLQSYGAVDGEKFDAHRIVPKRTLDWMLSRPLYYIHDFDPYPFIFVHAGLDHSETLAEQRHKTLMWKRYPPIASNDDVEAQREHVGGFFHANQFHVVVHGHTPNTNNPRWFGSFRLNIDSGAVSTNRLTVLRISDYLQLKAIVGEQ